MIEILGETGTAEREAAAALADAIIKLWPGIDTSPVEDDDIKIAANVKISGYPVSDIDIVACGRLKQGRRFVPRRALRDVSGNRIIGKPITVRNFAVAIEVKDHDARSVQITGDKINVRYSRGGPSKWKSATDQNIKQVHAIQGYFEDAGASLFIYRCLFMRGLDDAPAAGALPRVFAGDAFFSELAVTFPLRKSGRAYTIQSGSSEKLNRALEASIFHPIVPSALDRKRMDRIAVRSERIEALLPNLGHKMLQLRGHGGTGKTVMLLQLAWQQFRRSGQRTLVLTYNHALAADIRRLLALLGIASSPEEGGITVDTVMSFMFTWFSRLQLLDEEPDFKKYDELCREATTMLEHGAIRTDDVQAIIAADPDRFDFDTISVDEAQDWPENEVALLKALYTPKRLCLADGIDQLVRGKRTRWEAGVPTEDRVVEPLTRCLRMKRNLAVFANEIARDAHLAWDLVPSDEAGGGRIILLEGSYEHYPDLHSELLAQARDNGNDEIDFLFCVPASNVNKSGGSKSSNIATFLQHRGFKAWDGVDEVVRRDFPRSKDTFRVTQYASCRGLEGWVVVLEQLDLFWKERFDERMARMGEDGQEAPADIKDIATREAWRWTLIPLTRPIDTLVISLADPGTTLAKHVKGALANRPDLAELYARNTSVPN